MRVSIEHPLAGRIPALSGASAQHRLPIAVWDMKGVTEGIDGRGLNVPSLASIFSL